MWILEESFAFWVVIGVGVLAVIVACKTQTTGVVLGVNSAATGVYALLYPKAVYASVLLIFTGVAYLLCTVTVAIVRGKEKKRLALARKRKQEEYLLPNRGNSYLRARLNTVLRTGDIDDSLPQEPLRLAHAKQLLSQVKAKELSTAERLQIQDMEKLFSVYLQKESLRAEEIRLLSDSFAALLKLAAKYAV